MNNGVAAEPAAVVEPGRAARHVVISSFDSSVNPHYNGGGAAIVEMIAQRLNDFYDITVVTAGSRSETTVRNGVRYRYLPVNWAGPRAGQLLFHLLLPYVARKLPAHLWIESFTPPFSTSFVPVFSRARVIGFAQTLSGDEMSRLYRLPFFLIERLGLRFYRDVLVLNDADAEKVRRSNPAADIRAVPVGIDLPHAESASANGGGSHILCLGRIDMWHKGLSMLLQAYRDSGVQMPLVIAGAGTQREERRLQEMISAADGDVRWVGYVDGDQKRELLQQSAFFVLPSRHETFGLAALEAMSYGKPVIHFDLPGLRWIKGNIRVAPFDVESLAIKIREIASDEKVRLELGRVAHAAAQQYGENEAAEFYLAFVKEFLDNRTDGAMVKGLDPACQLDDKWS